MTPQELRNSILQRAIEGKLVEQRAEEGTGEELYKLIQKERKEKKFSKIKNEEILFDIPEAWNWIRLEEACNIINGFTPRRTNPEFWDGDIPWFTIDDVREQGRFINYTNQHITNKALSYKTERIIPSGTVLLCCTASVGEYAYTNIPLTTNQQFNGLVIKDDFKNLVSSMYLYVFSQTLKNRLISNSGKTTFNYLSVGKLKKFVVPIPPLAEQKRIVDKIEELIPLIDDYEKNWQRLEELNKKFPDDMKKSLLQEAIKGNLVEQRAEEGTGEELYKLIQEEKKKLIKEGKIKKQKALDEIKEEEIPFDIPKNWKWVRLGEIIDFQGGYAFKSSSYVAKSKNQVIRLGNVKQNYLLTDAKSVFISDDSAKETEAYRIRQNDILVTMTGTRRKKDYLFVTLVTEEDMSGKKLFLNQRVGCFRLLKCVDHKYILRALQSDQIRDIIFEKETGTANQGNLGSEDMQMYIYIPLPPLAEQKRIVEKLEELLPLCDELINKEK